MHINIIVYRSFKELNCLLNTSLKTHLTKYKTKNYQIEFFQRTFRTFRTFHFIYSCVALKTIQRYAKQTVQSKRPSSGQLLSGR